MTDPQATLTHRELECLRWVAAGKTDLQIARLLGVSQTTARTHIDQARRKLGARTRSQAVATSELQSPGAKRTVVIREGTGGDVFCHSSSCSRRDAALKTRDFEPRLFASLIFGSVRCETSRRAKTVRI